jgi:hypothetical protein
MDDSTFKPLGEYTADIVATLVHFRTRELLRQARRCERIMDAKAANKRWLRVWTAVTARVDDIDIQTRRECK